MAVTPLDYPVSAANLGAGYTVQTDFATEIVAVGAVNAGETVAVGDVRVPADAAVSLAATADVLPLRAPSGLTTFPTLHGEGLVAGSTLSRSTRRSRSATSSSRRRAARHRFPVSFQLDIAGGTTSPGHADLQVTTPAASAPSCPPRSRSCRRSDRDDARPGHGRRHGGTSLTITGTGFRAGARVVIGPNIYYDGGANGCTVVDATTITLTTLATPGGTYDAVVIDETGVEGRKGSAFTPTPTCPRSPRSSRRAARPAAAPTS